MKKVLCIAVMSVLLFISVPLSAFASDVSQHVSCTSVKVYNGTSWNTKAYTWATQSNGRRLLTVANDGTNFKGLDAVFSSAGYVKVESGYYFECRFYFNDTWAAASANANAKFSLKLTDSKMNEYIMTPVVNLEPDNWSVSFYGKVGDGDQSVSLGTFEFITTAQSASLGTGAYTIDCYFVADSMPTAEQKRHAETLHAINDAADTIASQIDESTDKIINEDFGYQQSEQDKENLNAIQTFTSQVNDLNAQLDASKQTIEEGANGFITSAIDFGGFINGFLGGLPVALIGLLVGLMIFLLLRKVVGR